MKLRNGGRYLTRNGYIVGPLKQEYKIYFTYNNCFWMDGGKFNGLEFGEHEDDLVEEYFAIDNEDFIAWLNSMNSAEKIDKLWILFKIKDLINLK